MNFDSYHPTINLFYFTVAAAGALCFDHPVYLAVSYAAAFLFSLKKNGKRALVFNLCLIPLVFLYAGFYSYYHHFGVTNLRTNFIGNQITLEAVVAGLVRGFSAATVVMIFSCVFAVMSADKFVYLFGRISPRLSLFLSVLLRAVPRVKERAGKISRARAGIGRGCGQGSAFVRLRGVCGLVSALITWTLEDFMESAASMKCRGYSLKGRTAFSIYRFDNRDRMFVLALFSCLAVTLMGAALDQTQAFYAPRIIFHPVTPMSFLFCGAYALFLLLPLLSEWACEISHSNSFIR